MRATPGVEAVDRDSYRRTISFDGRFGTFEVRRVAGRDYLELRIDFPDPDAFPQIAERAGRIFDVDTDPRAVSSHLRRDARLSPLVEAHPGLRVPGAWDGFELTVRAILGQQVTVKAATTLAGRLAFRYGERFSDGELGVIFPRAEVLSKADPSGLGLPKARAQAIPQLARAVCRGELSFNGTPDLRAFVRQMKRVPGIGEWTAQYVAMRALSHPDAFPATDLGLLRGASSGRKGIQPKTLLGRAEKWRPFRAYAAMYLWKSYGMKMTGTR
jgi:AraC family transcriptional regulator of adaptative response / DNA-3-methyladenine glycosylase II